MSASPSASSSTVVGRARHLVPGSGRTDLIRLALLLVGAWVLPVAAYLAHVAWVVPPVVLLAAASLLRGGRSLLDRVVMAAVLLFAALGAGGLLFSVWPWHLHPVAVGGVALTALVAFGQLGGRRPALPRPRATDGLSVAAASIVGLAYAYPLIGAGDESRLSTLMLGWDGVRHSMLIDTIRQLGGYLFLQPERATEHVYHGLVYYPQGGHLLFGVLDNFLRSSATQTGSGMSAMNHYLGYAALTYGVFALAVLWAVQRLAEPMLTPGRRLVLVAVTAAYLLSNHTFYLAMIQFTPQILSLGLVAVLAAVLARPPARSAEALWLVAALLVAIGFTYYLYLPPAGLAVLIWLYARRRLLSRALVVTTLVAGALSTVPAVIGLVVAGQDSALLVGAATPGWDGQLLAAGIGGAGLIRAWRTPRWRVHGVLIGSALLALAGIIGVQRLQGAGSGSYYYTNKILDLVMLLFVLAGGSLLAFLPDPQAAAQPRLRAPRSWPRLAPAVAVAVAVAAASGLVVGDSPYQSNGAVYARGWVAGAWRDYYHPTARTALAELERPVPPGTITMIMREDAQDAWTTQELVSAMLRQSGIVAPGLLAENVYGKPYENPDFYDRMLEALAPHPVLIVVDTAATRRAAEALRDRHPDMAVTIAGQAGQ